MLEKALVVDNNKVILKILSHTLEKRGLQVRTAKDGLSALEVLEEFQPDILFTDLIMPNIDGESLCRIIGRRQEMSAILLIVISAVAAEDDIDFQSFGAHACIAKGPASDMAKSIDLILSHAAEGRFDLVKGRCFGAENLVPRTIAKELLEAKHHLKVVLNNIDNGIIEFSREGRVVDCNSYASGLLARDPLEILSSAIDDVFSGETYRHVRDCLALFRSSHEPVESTKAVAVGERYIVFKFVRMPEGEGGTSLMILRDITVELRARRKLEQYLGNLELLVAQKTRKYEEANTKLEYAARQWSNTFDAISDFVSVHDINMKFVRVNKALADFFKADPEELMGRYCYEVMHGRSAPCANCPHAASIEQRKVVTFELDEESVGIPLLVSCSPLMDDDGTLFGSVHVARDISEQKKADALREMLIRQLEESLAKVKLLSGLLPICASCKKIRDDKGYWKQIEEYIRDHSEAQFSHSICPDCMKKLYPDFF